MPVKPLRFVIAGGPGSGKSTLLAALAQAGEHCYEEVSRQLIREQIACGGKLLPWSNLAGFASACGSRMRALLADSIQHPRVFFDRGLPDLIGYLRYGGLQPPQDLLDAAALYTPLVFLAPPWENIYANDPERPQSYQESVELSRQIRLAYLECGFRIIELIKSSVHDRLNQVLAHVNLHIADPESP